MARYLWLGILSLLSATSALAQSCTTSNARSIDLDFAFLAYWEILAVSWAAIAAVGKRTPLPLASLNKRDLVCTSSEQCLSFKEYPFCDNPSTHTFHAADGTTGNFLTGEYTLADGRQGNMYHGPYPTNTIAAAASTTQTESTAASMVNSVTITGASSMDTPVVSSAEPSTTVSQQAVGSSQVGSTTATKPSVTSTPSSSTVLKSGGSWIGLNSCLTGSRSVIITLFGFLLYM